MEKKGNMGGYIVVIVGLVLAILLFVNLAFPQIRTTTTPQAATDTLTAHVKGAGATTTTLTNTDLVLNGVSVGGLTNGSNYTVDYTTAVVTVLNDTANGTYTASYTYYAAGYIESSGTRAMASVLVLLLIVGLVGGALRMFGVL